MRNFKILYLIFTISCFLIGCADNLKICDGISIPEEIKFSTRLTQNEIQSVRINDKEIIEQFTTEICNTERLYINGTNGEIETTKIYYDGVEVATFAKHLDGRYYFRDKNGKFKNEKLANKIVELVKK